MALFRRRQPVIEREPVVYERRRPGILGSIGAFFAQLVSTIVSVVLWVIALVILAILLIWLL
jgi:hypothetical protein